MKTGPGVDDAIATVLVGKGWGAGRSDGAFTGAGLLVAVWGVSVVVVMISVTTRRVVVSSQWGWGLNETVGTTLGVLGGEGSSVCGSVVVDTANTVVVVVVVSGAAGVGSRVAAGVGSCAWKVFVENLD